MALNPVDRRSLGDFLGRVDVSDYAEVRALVDLHCSRNFVLEQIKAKISEAKTAMGEASELAKGTLSLEEYTTFVNQVNSPVIPPYTPMDRREMINAVEDCEEEYRWHSSDDCEY